MKRLVCFFPSRVPGERMRARRQAVRPPAPRLPVHAHIIGEWNQFFKLQRMKTLFHFRALQALFLVAAAQTAAQTPVYLDSTAAVEVRVEDLLGRMTIDEKIGQMTQADYTALRAILDVKTYLVGSVLNGGGSDPANNLPVTWANAYDAVQAAAVQTRLKIPAIYGVDAVHGHNNVLGATIFPHNIGLGCTRDSALVRQAAEVTAVEVAATGIDWTFSPCVTVPRNERWGRTYEGFGESPDLVRSLAAAAVRGYQGDSLAGGTSILACAKHFVGDGGTSGGVDQGNTVLDEAALRAIHLPGYIAAIQSGVGSIMISYSSWNGQKMHGNGYLITDVLKGELGFKGFVVTDWAGINQLPGSYASQVQASVNAGIDMVMVPYDYITFISTLRTLVSEGKVAQDRIDDAVRRILTIKFRMRLFERPFTDRSLLADVGSAAHREVARKCVRESLVLLKKKDGVLPLPRNGATIFVAGSNADDIGNQCGGWTIAWQGQSGPVTTGTTVLGAMQKAAGTSRLVYSKNGTFSDSSCDYSVVVIGETPYAEGYGDRTDLTVASVDAGLVKKMKSYGKPVVVVLISGRPLIIAPILHYADAIIAAWLPGTEGDGVADVLFGDSAPHGVLSQTWPKSMAQIPINVGDSVYAPLYSYGFGITSFADPPEGSAPAYCSSIITADAGHAEITFSKPISGASLPGAQVAVTRNGTPMTGPVSAALKQKDSTTILLDLGGAVDPGDTVTLQYLGGGMQSADGGKVPAFGPVEAYNEAKSAPLQIPGKIEAEDFSDMAGVQTEATTDAGGGLDVGSIDTGDWLEYAVNVKASGTYAMSLRVASRARGGSITVKSNGSVLFRRSLPLTGGWQTWITDWQAVSLQAGSQTLRIQADTGGFNLNWFALEPLTSTPSSPGMPARFALHQNYPNPFNPATTISYELASAGEVRLSVLDVLGKEVALLVDGVQQSGRHDLLFDGTRLASGVYFCRLRSGASVLTRAMVLVR